MSQGAAAGVDDDYKRVRGSTGGKKQNMSPNRGSKSPKSSKTGEAGGSKPAGAIDKKLIMNATAKQH